VAEVRRVLSARERIRGEIVLLIDATPLAMPANVGGSILQQLSQLMETEGLDEKDALKRVARERGVSKSDVYRELQRERSKR
jgi:16S rRNA (cytidine1402-2'-O)-methyltransferase